MGRGGRDARRAAFILVVLSCGPPPAARSQVTIGLGLGGVASTHLVRDSIVETIAVRPQVAPQVTVRVEAPLAGRYRLSGDLAVSHSNVMAHGSGASTKVTGLTLWSPGVSLRAAAAPWLGAEARIGILIYDPGDTGGTLFADGAPVTPQIGLGLHAERALGGALAASLDLRYDVHRFTTSSLRARGFTGGTVVHRVALGLTLYRRLGRVPTTR